MPLTELPRQTLVGKELAERIVDSGQDAIAAGAFPAYLELLLQAMDPLSPIRRSGASRGSFPKNAGPAPLSQALLDWTRAAWIDGTRAAHDPGSRHPLLLAASAGHAFSLAAHFEAERAAGLRPSLGLAAPYRDGEGSPIEQVDALWLAARKTRPAALAVLAFETLNVALHGPVPANVWDYATAIAAAKSSIGRAIHAGDRALARCAAEGSSRTDASNCVDILDLLSQRAFATPARGDAAPQAASPAPAGESVAMAAMRLEMEQMRRQLAALTAPPAAAPASSRAAPLDPNRLASWRKSEPAYPRRPDSATAPKFRA